MLSHFDSEAMRQKEVIDAMREMGRMGSAKEVAEAVVWLCSLAASFVTSHAKVVDGGHSRPNGLINLLK